MKKNNFNPLSEYYDLYYETGTFGYKKNTVSLDGKIEDTIFDIIVDLNDVSRFDMSLDIVDKMFRLSSLITERFCNGKVFEPTNEMLTLLSRELEERFKNSDYNPYLVIGTGDVIKSVNLLLGDEAVLSIETFDEDRFKNDLMVSCNRVRNTRPVTSSRVVSPNYIFGDNGIYINAGNKNIISIILPAIVNVSLNHLQYAINAKLSLSYFPFNTAPTIGTTINITVCIDIYMISKLYNVLFIFPSIYSYFIFYSSFCQYMIFEVCFFV